MSIIDEEVAGLTAVDALAVVTKTDRGRSGRGTANPLARSPEFFAFAQAQEKIEKIKDLKHKLEIFLLKDLYPNIYKTLRQEAKKLDAAYRTTFNKETEAQLQEKTRELGDIRNKIEAFCTEIFRLGNAALFKVASDEDGNFYQKMIDLIKTRRLFEFIELETKENAETSMLVNVQNSKSTEPKSAEKMGRTKSDSLSFQQRLAALNISGNPGAGPQPIAARSVLYQLQGNAKSEDKNKSLSKDHDQKKQVDPSQ